MKKLSLITSILMLLISCVETEYDCGEVATRIVKLNQGVGTYNSDQLFAYASSSNFDEAAILIEIIETEGRPKNCEAYTPMPQLIESIVITSAKNVKSGGIEYLAGEGLNELFDIKNRELTFTISEFIEAQNDEPTIFDSESDKVVFQLLEKPDLPIKQAFTIDFTFADLETFNIEIPSFEVSD
jgi:hypothetical protein